MRKWAVLGGVAAIVLVYGETTDAHSIYSCRVLPTARDLAKNISVVTDPTCAFSGVGCITTLCRYCRVNSHTNYPNLLLCSDIKFAAPVPATIIPVPTTSVPSPVPTTRAPTPAPTISTLAPVPTTSEPLPFTETPASSGDSSQSEDPIFDPTEVDDAAFVLTCYTKVSSGDAAVGIGVITDVSCVLGGIGCVNDVCRYCQVRYTTQSSHLTPCSSVVLNNGDDIDFTPLPTLDSDDSGIVVGAIDRPLLYQIIIPDITAPVTIAPAPTTTAPPTTSVPTPATTTSAPTSTAPPVTATTPPPTTTAPTPIPTTRTPTPTTTSPAPATTVPATTAPTPAPTTVAPSPTTTAPPPTTVTPAPTTRAPTSTPTTTAPVPTPMAPAPTTRAPTPATTAPSPTATAPASTTRAPSSTTSAPTPTPAPTTRAPTPTTTAPAPTTRAPTPAPTTRAPVTTAPSATVDTCAASVSTGDASVGISAYTDSTCASGGLGCFNAKCRYCKTVDTLQSQHLLACKKAVDPCLSSVSGGDAAVGISAVTDTTCQAGGLGCFSSTCRYCKTMNTLQSQHLLFCSAL